MFDFIYLKVYNYHDYSLFDEIQSIDRTIKFIGVDFKGVNYENKMKTEQKLLCI